MGRPPADIDEEQLRRLAAMQCTHEEIAAFFGVHRNTISNRFGEVVEQERNKAKASLRRRMFQEAVEGDARMMIWLSKQYLGMSEKTEHQGDGLRPLTIEFAEAKPPQED